MRSHAPYKDLKAAYKELYRGQRKCRYQKRRLTTSHHRLGVAASAADDCGLQLPNQSLKPDIDFATLPNLGGTSIEMLPAKNQNSKHASDFGTLRIHT